MNTTCIETQASHHNANFQLPYSDISSPLFENKSQEIMNSIINNLYGHRDNFYTKEEIYLPEKNKYPIVYM
mgnify:CR=1 FL=1